MSSDYDVPDDDDITVPPTAVAANPSSDYTQNTQVDSPFDDLSAIAAASSVPVQPRPWARLVSQSAEIPPKDLHPITDEEIVSKYPAGISNLVTLGRSKKTDFTFKSQKVSNMHCKIYCQTATSGNFV